MNSKKTPLKCSQATPQERRGIERCSESLKLGIANKDVYNKLEEDLVLLIIKCYS